ncbi:ATP-dependent DNA helicase RecQ [Enterococcus hirae]|nr:ATP-dependent DNA helicase RecQ [Enterococcus hirae]
MVNEILQQKFGITDLRPAQKKVLKEILAGRDCLAILPTGSGKSLCYQLPAYLRSGSVIVISPLLSLMEDQVDQLEKIGERRAVALNSLLSFSEQKAVLQRLPSFRFLFMSPEMLLKKEVQAALKQSTIQLMVVDEAHCVSQWGLDFRPEYLQLGALRQKLKIPQLLALTATAPPNVARDIVAKLFTNTTPKVISLPVDRPNIGLKVVKTADKLAVLLDYLKRASGDQLIYCATRRACEALSFTLREAGYDNRFYHGGLSGNERRMIQQEFLQGKVSRIIATSAFGMGINKPDVRWVFHYTLSPSLEDYVQEIGRAGRDGKKSLAVLLYAPGDEKTFRFIYDDRQQKHQLLKSYQESAGQFAATLASQPESVQAWWEKIPKSDPMRFEEELSKREGVQVQQLAGMLHFIETSYCRREVIREYFADPPFPKSAFCCDLDSKDMEAQVPQQPETKKVSVPQNWQERLAELFNINPKF